VVSADGYSVYKSNKISCRGCHEEAKTDLLNSFNTEYDEKEKIIFINHLKSCNDNKCRKYNKLCYLIKGLLLKKKKIKFNKLSVTIE